VSGDLPPGLSLEQLLDALKNGGMGDGIQVIDLAKLMGPQELKYRGLDLVIDGETRIDSIDSAIEHGKAKAVELFESQGDLRPVGMVWGTRNLEGHEVPEGRCVHYILGAPSPFDEEGKSAFSRALQHLAWEADAVATMFISESWISENAELIQNGVRPSEDPGRFEAISVMEERIGRQTSCRVRILRDDNGEGCALRRNGVVHWEYSLPGTQLGGRFAHLIVTNATCVPVAP
jgi:hypothetical protein